MKIKEGSGEDKGGLRFTLLGIAVAVAGDERRVLHVLHLLSPLQYVRALPRRLGRPCAHFERRVCARVCAVLLFNLTWATHRPEEMLHVGRNAHDGLYVQRALSTGVALCEVRVT